ncbi:hypothetical protein KZ829_37110 [Actinoplanes hulinensis]|uniref:DUF5666 domain-containing protein n=1 Tax=Actinoplanes hulinensis TaxID=1144547 RepID=A0ABS7BER2_9ACTN|nr:hypothetical protein [Actinoplanes hulinensis]MBW6439359.1 hypothetical protein [Actinoplanes hulinensis]
MTRTPKILMAGIALALVLTGCGSPDVDTPDVGTPDVDTAAEVVALQEVGFTEVLADGPSTAPGKVRPHAVRKLLRKNALHGEVVVETRDGGTRTIVVQRGEVTAVEADRFTVKSSDGFEGSWTFGDPLRVVDRVKREKTERDAVTVGATVGVGGVRDGSATAARLIIVG